MQRIWTTSGGKCILPGGPSFGFQTTRYSFRYSFSSCGAVSEFTELLPEESGAEFSTLVEEGKLVARAPLQAALDVAHSAAWTMSSVVAIWRSSWLQASGLLCEVQQTIQNLPSEGLTRFSEKMDSQLHSLKDSRATLKSLDLHIPSIVVEAF